MGDAVARMIGMEATDNPYVSESQMEATDDRFVLESQIDEFELLTGSARSDLYRENAFLVSGLAFEAVARVRSPA